MRRLRSSASLHTARGLLRLAGKLQRGRRWRWRSASEAARRRGPYVLHIASRRRRATDVVAASGSAAFPLRRWRRSTCQRAVDWRWWAHRRWRPRHVPFHRYVSRRRNVARAPGALGLRTPAHPARRRREAIRQRRGRRRAEPLRRRHAERARRREALAWRARVLLAHGARSAAAARAPSRRRHAVSHAARPLYHYHWPGAPLACGGCGTVPISAFTRAPWRSARSIPTRCRLKLCPPRSLHLGTSSHNRSLACKLGSESGARRKCVLGQDGRSRHVRKRSACAIVCDLFVFTLFDIDSSH